MTQQQILTGLKLNSDQLTKKYAGKLVLIFNLINELEKLEGFKVSLSSEIGNVDMVKALPELVREKYHYSSSFYEAQKQQDNCRNVFGLFEQWVNVSVSHDKGCYTFPFPVNNVFYDKFLGMAGMQVNEVKKDVFIKETIILDASILKSFSKALKFISKDYLRPAMQCVLIHCNEGKATLVSTDAHKLYTSQQFDCSQNNDTKLLISESDAKRLSKIKPLHDVIELHILLDDNQILVDDEIINLVDARFPDYKVVIPEYETFMEFEKDSFVKNIKKVIPYANKSTSQVNFHLNGSIALHTQDVDFSFECDAEMPYISKNFIDTDIAFNGKFLLETCSIFKDKTLKFYSEGKNTKGAIISNGNESVLLMPLMIGGDY